MWQKLNGVDSDVAPPTFRLRVPGGWILKIGEESCFKLDDPLHQWDSAIAALPVSPVVPEPPVIVELTPVVPKPPVIVDPVPVVPNPPVVPVVLPPVIVAPPTPVVTPVVTTKKTNIGTNLMELRDWSGYFPFVNLAHQSRDWISGVLYGAWSDNRVLDIASGVLTVSGNQVARKMLFSKRAFPPGNLVLTWTGTATVQLSGATNVVRAANSIVFQGSSENIWIDVSNGTLQNLKVVQEKHLNSNELFNSDFISDISKYNTVRFMDLQQTNVQRTAAQMDQDFVADRSFTGNGSSVPLDFLIEMQNAANVNGWYCLPINAGNIYIERFLNAIKSKIKSGLIAYVEYSNEVWNGMFPQHTYFSTNYDQNMTAFANRFGEIAGMVKRILGNQGQAVLAGQSSNIWWIENMLKMIQANSALRMPDVLSTAPYFGHSLPDVFDFAAFEKEIADSCSQALAAKQLSDKYGMKFAAYELGSHITANGGMVVNRDPRMEQIYAKYFSDMNVATNHSLLCHFSYVGPYGTSGSWGLKEMQYGDETGKWKAMSKLLNS